ncbi:MAG: class I SAM-dependent methyltransferase [Elusimicrobia bacterium]|nr:class I SAM-dependent methyltransferase [Elusimicrobiota bacterium]
MSTVALPPKTAWWKACFEDATRRQQPQHVRSRVDGMTSLLALEPRSRILDLCCGLGQEALEFARRGHRVMGLDSTEEALREGRTAAKGTSLFSHFVKGDMRNIPYSGEFDAIVVRHPAFGHFARERDDLRSLQNIRKALKPGGRLLMKLVNRDWVIRHLSPNGHEHGLTFDFATGRLEGYRTRADSRAPTSFRLYALTELLRLLEEAELAPKRVSGRFDGTPYDLHSFHMIVLAERGKDAPKPPRDEDDGLPRALKIKGRGR